MSVSLIARQEGVSASLLFQWRKLEHQGALTAVSAGGPWCQLLSSLPRAPRLPSSRLSDRPMSQSDVYRMIGRRAEAADVATKIGCHSFRATGITEYLRNGSQPEVAQQMANHKSHELLGSMTGDTIRFYLMKLEKILI